MPGTDADEGSESIARSNQAISNLDASGALWAGFQGAYSKKAPKNEFNRIDGVTTMMKRRRSARAPFLQIWKENPQQLCAAPWFPIAAAGTNRSASAEIPVWLVLLPDHWNEPRSKPPPPI